jgi:hypothetical protein
MGRIMPFAPRILRGYPATTDALDEPELLLLLGLRCWVSDLRAAVDPLPRLHEAMAAVGAPDAAASLDMLMRVVARTARRPLGIGCPHCPRLAPDEQRLLHAARLAQGREAWLAEEALRTGLLSDVGAEFALGPLQGLGELLAAAGFRLWPRSLLELPESAAEGVMPWMPFPVCLH